MKALVHLLIGVLGLWLQTTLAPMIAIGGIRPNLMLLFLLILVLRWPSPWLFVFGALAGLALDSFSSGLLGVYALSFFAIAIIARMAGSAIYENNLISNIVVVFGLTLVHGGIALGIFRFLNPGVPWWWWMFSRVVPEALYTAACAPVVFWLHEKLERRLQWGREGWEF
ncbi:MAG TPA: rod shape-determining protein MreD [bacterium]